MEIKKLDEFTAEDLQKAKYLQTFFKKAKIEIEGEVAPLLGAVKIWLDGLSGRIEYIIKEQEKKKFMEKDILAPVEKVEKKTRRKKA